VNQQNTIISTSNKIADDYFALLAQFYGESEAVHQYVSDSRKGLQKVLTSIESPALFFHVRRQDILVGHIALIPAGESSAFFGFFECVDEEIFNILWESILCEAHRMGIKSLFGPVNGTIWHPYRVVTTFTDEPFFPSEPISRMEYAAWLTKKEPQQLIEYHSAYRTDYTPIIEATRTSYQNAIENGLVIGSEAIGMNNIQELYSLAVEVFSQNPGYVHLSIEQFIALYSSDKISKNSATLYTARTSTGKLVGFCLNLANSHTLIMKTIAVSPSAQQKGIGNALVHIIHLDAGASGFTKVIYALVRKDNNVRHFPTDKITVFREYAAYQFKV
jgi:ribosomal protein S18 acetylase RimI-like enzyme